MQYAILGLLLDCDARQVARGVSGLVAVALMALLLAVAIPVAFVGGLASGGSVLGSSGMATQPEALPLATQSPVLVLPASTGDLPVGVARRYLGVPYVFGGSNPATGLDCSGLVQLVFRQLGIALPRTAQSQYEATSRVPRDKLEPGDLVFFARTYADPHDWITHVGIYVGGGMQINAPTEGQVVSMQPVFSGFWGSHYAGAGRTHRV